MNAYTRSLTIAVLAAACATGMLAAAQRGSSAGPACAPDNAGLRLPAGFCALVVAEGLGTARHLIRQRLST